ncbi:MAG: hypothetical protein B7Y77_01795 [Bradyrhizobium sp. 35-63-5]|nr:MAG: hypothetical protein B7Y77_01795 [Bradyrhizobium sp. 35-63-5]
MGIIKQMAAPIRAIVRFPQFQLVIVVAIILFLQAAEPASALGRLFTGLDKLVSNSVDLCAALFNIRSFTKSWINFSFWVGYVYLACLLILALLQVLVRLIVDLAGRSNAFGLRNAIARERGIAAYRAWEPFERIRPPHIPQPDWEERFAWPADNSPPYPPLAHRILTGLIINIAVIAAILVLLQIFTPFPVVTWLAALLKTLIGH